MAVNLMLPTERPTNCSKEEHGGRHCVPAAHSWVPMHVRAHPCIAEKRPRPASGHACAIDAQHSIRKRERTRCLKLLHHFILECCVGHRIHNCVPAIPTGSLGKLGKAFSHGAIRKLENGGRISMTAV